jgi:hypothetical protein
VIINLSGTATLITSPLYPGPAIYPGDDVFTGVSVGQGANGVHDAVIVPVSPGTATIAAPRYAVATLAVLNPVN